MNKELEKEFEKLSIPLIEFLRENFHSHCTIIIDSNNAKLLEGLIAFRKDL